MIEVPEAMAWHGRTPAGRAWLDGLPSLAAECAAAWELTLGEPFAGSNLSLVVPAGPAVLKLGFSADDVRREADALALWDGAGAARLLAFDESRRALLVERCEPGTQLARLESPDEVLRVAAELLARLWTQPPPGHRFPALAEELGSWAEELPAQWERLGRPFERALVEETVAAVRELAADGDVVLHGDFHSGNVLAARREPWLAIDPVPLLGERAFDAASLLRDRRWEVTSDSLKRRIDVLAAELGLERERIRRWGVVHALFWGMSWEKLEEDLVLAARLLRS